jgi:hypothetical protein
VLISSEGVNADVLRITLPTGFTTNAGTTTAARPPRASERPAADGRKTRDWVGIALVAVAVAAGGYLALRGSRLRPPRGG